VQWDPNVHTEKDHMENLGFKILYSGNKVLELLFVKVFTQNYQQLPKAVKTLTNKTFPPGPL